MTFHLVKNKLIMKTLARIFCTLIFVFYSVFLFADDFPKRPYPPRLVNDFTNFLQDHEKNRLEQKLVRFNNETSTQIAIVILKDLKGYDKADYAFGLAEKWGIGQAGKNNGILILIKPKTPESKGEVFIATGYGLEGAVPDAIAKRIVENEILPKFRNSDYFSGLDEATNILMELTKGEYTADEYLKRTNYQNPGIFVWILFIIIFVIFSLVGRARRARQYSLGHNIPFWMALMMMGGSRGSHRGSYGNFSSGGGSFGGFSGFGGGSFGGGGAGGSW